MQQRIGALQQYLVGVPGEIGIVLRDRRTGAVWQNANAGEEMPAASTVKLAMAVDLLIRDQAGQIQLSAWDRQLIDQMLYGSSDPAADQLWSEYEDGSFLTRIGGYGLPGAQFTRDPPYWGYMYVSPADLSGLINYTLQLPASISRLIADRLSHVDADQQFGVWGAGPQNQPGNKDGWEYDSGVWIIDTVGFAGPNARYTLSIMDRLDGGGGFNDGATTLTEIAALLFQGHLAAAPTVEATP